MQYATRTALALATSALLPAQTYTLTDANVAYTQSHANTPGDSCANFSVAGCASDDVYAFSWCFSLDGTTFGTTLDPIDPHAGYLQLQSSPNLMTQFFTDVQGMGLFDAVWEDFVQSTGPNSGDLISTLSITNRSQADLLIRVYSYLDADFNAGCCGANGDYTLPRSGPGRISIGDNDSCGGCLEFTGVGATHYQVDSFNGPFAPRLNIQVGGIPLNLGLPFASESNPDDFTAVFHWSATIPANRSRTFIAQVSSIRAGNAASVTNVGVSSGGTIPMLSGSPPRIGREFSIFVTGGAGPMATLLLALDPSPGQVPVFGIQLLASPPIATVSIPLIAGTGSLALVAPCEPAFGGVALATQAVVVDPGSPAAIPISTSDILVSTIGN